MICVFLEFSYYNKERRDPLFSDIPQLFDLGGILNDKLFPFIRYSPIMSSIISFEFDLNYVISIPKHDKKLFFPRANNLTHITIAFYEFHDCIRFLNQIGASLLHSLNVDIMHVRLTEELDLSQISLVSLFCFVYCNLIIFLFNLDILSNFKRIKNENISKYFCI